MMGKCCIAWHALQVTIWRRREGPLSPPGRLCVGGGGTGHGAIVVPRNIAIVNVQRHQIQRCQLTNPNSEQPIVEQTASQFGVPSISTAYSMVIGNIIGTFVSPFSPALWLAIGLAEANMGTYIKYAFFWVWGFAIVMLLIAMLIGVVTF